MKAYATVLIALTMTLAAGCSQEGGEGTAEKAGKELDQAMEKASDYAGEKMGEAGKAIEHAGEELKK